MTDHQVSYKFYIKMNINSEMMVAKFSVKGAYNRGQDAQEYCRPWAFNHFTAKWAGSRAACEKITVSGINKHPHHCVMCMVYA
jgi:hypothetical protein